MFDSIAVRRISDYGKIQLDLGAVCEALLYYQRINLLLDPSTLQGLLSQIGTANVLSLVSHRSVRAHYFDEILTTPTSDFGGMHISKFQVVSYVTSEKPKSIAEETLRLTLLAAFEKPEFDAVFIRKFLKKVRVRGYSRLRLGNSDITSLVADDLEDESYVNQGAKIALLGLVPNFNIPEQWYLRAIRVSEGVVIDTNFDFTAINAAYKAIPGRGTAIWYPEEIGATTLLHNLLETRSQIMICADYMSEVMTSDVVARSMRLKFSHLLQRTDQSRESLDSFRQLLLPEGRSIREVINSGERSLSDFFRLLDQAERFKEWLSSSSPDEQLINEYVKCVSATSWLDKLPSRVIRFALFTGAGLLADTLVPSGLGTITGIGLSVGDAFLLDKLVKGWRPNQFVEGPLQNFVR